MNTSRKERTIKELFIGNCWEYLNNNFHKFTEQNKIKIALELCKKDIPVELRSDPDSDIGTKVYVINRIDLNERINHLRHVVSGAQQRASAPIV
jgi:hypothetical protein